MRTRLLPLLIVLMAAVLLALGIPLALSVAAAQQQKVVVDRIDDTARFASLAQFVAESADTARTTRTTRTAPTTATARTARTARTPPATGSLRATAASSRRTARPNPAPDETDERRETLQKELTRYYQVYGIRAGVYARNGTAIAQAPGDWSLPARGELHKAFEVALASRPGHDPDQVWPWQRGRLAVAAPVVRDGDVVSVVVTDSPTGQMRARTLHGWLLIAAGEAATMLVAVGAALRLTRWVLRPVRVLDATTHDIATGRLKSRVAAAGGPPELRRLARSFNEMADHVQQVLEQQRAFVADASHQLRNPLSALLLRIELLALELPEDHAEIGSVRAEGKRLTQVLDDLLDLALAEHAAADLRVTDIGELAAERVEAWRPVADDKGVRLAGHCPAVTAWADPIALSSALDAVVDNALKFTPPGEEVAVTVATNGDTSTIVVADRGPGLTDDELARIGDRFWRSNRHQNVGGSGLGLSISGALLAAGGGTIEYGHHEPRGLKVSMRVPRSAPPQ